MPNPNIQAQPTILQRSWTYVQNAGTSSATLLTKTAVPFLRRRLDPQSASLATIIQWANLFMNDVEQATVGSRSLPFGAGGTVILPITFKVGTNYQIPHYLKTASLIAFWSIPSSGFGNIVGTVTFDNTYAYVTPNSEFTAGMFIVVVP